MSVYEPIYIVEIDGKLLPEDISDKVESFTYEDHEDKLDELTLDIVDVDLVYVDHPMLQEGCEVKARWGYIGNLSNMRVCTIKEISYDFGTDGVPRITIIAYDKGHKLTGRAARTCWSNKKLEDVVGDIASKHNLKPVVDIPGDYDREFLSQGGKNDFEFLKGLAAEMGCKTWVENDELHFAPNRTTGNATHTFDYRRDGEGLLKSFSVTSNAEKGKGTGAETEVSGIDPIKKQPFEETYTSQEESVTMNLVSGRELNETPHQARHDETGLTKATPSHTKAEAKNEAKGRVRTEGMETIEGRATVIGIPHLMAKDTIRIEGIGQKLSGLWRAKSVRHQISDAGYECEVNAVRGDSNAGTKQLSQGGKTPANNEQKSAEANRSMTPVTKEVDLT